VKPTCDITAERRTSAQNQVSFPNTLGHCAETRFFDRVYLSTQKRVARIAMPHLALSLFGPFQAVLDERPLSGFVSRRAKALLIFLAVEANRPHSREELVGLLWPDYPESSARANLRSVLANMRNVIGDHEATPPFLTITRQTIQFNLESNFHLDVADFLQESLPRILDDLAVERLEKAVGKGGHTFLAGFSMPDSPAYEEWVLLKRAVIERQISATLLCLARHFEEQDELERALRHARQWADMDPWQEEAHRLVMRLLASAGRRNEALQHYETCRRLLAEELGTEPTESTRKLYEQLQQGECLDGEQQDLPSHHAVSPPSTRLIGRETELTNLARMLADPNCRLITLVGPGGIGKTYLAMAAAAACRQFRDGACMVELAPLQSPADVMPSVAKALGISFPGETEPQQQLLNYLRARELLLVLDNYEHLVDDLEPIVSILEAAPGIHVLATSRLRLGLAGEQLFPVQGLAYPDVADTVTVDEANSLGRYAAIQLFCQVAQRMRPDFSLSTENRKDIARICALVSGVPLGIVLAASWIEMLDPDEICTEIERGFEFLETDLRELPARQRSVEAVFEQTWKLLNAQERSISQQLSIFRGGFTRQAAMAVTEVELPSLLALVHKFLLRRMFSDRYEIHELLRQYSLQKLLTSSADYASARRRHSVYYLDLVRKKSAELRGYRQQEALAEIDIELENIRVAWQWSVQQRDVMQLDGVMEGLGLYCDWRGWYREGETLCRSATELLTEATPDHERRVLAMILYWQARLNRLMGNSHAARQLADLALDSLDALAANGQDVRAQRAAILLEVAIQLGYSDEAIAVVEQSCRLYRMLNEPWGLAQSLFVLGKQRFYRFEAYALAEQDLLESLRYAEDLGDMHSVAKVTGELGFFANLHGRAEESEVWLRDSLDINRKVRDRAQVVHTLDSLASLYADNYGRFAEARDLAGEARSIAQDLGNWRWIGSSTAMMVFAEMHLGCFELAHRYAVECRSLAEEIDDPYRLSFSLWMLGDVSLAEGRLDEAEDYLSRSIAMDWLGGNRARVNDILISWAYSGYWSDVNTRIAQCLVAILPGILDDRLWFSAIRTLPLSALYALEQNRPEFACELWAMALGQPHIANSTWYRLVVGRRIDRAANSLSSDALADARTRGEKRELWSTIRELLSIAESGVPDRLKRPVGSRNWIRMVKKLRA
jgi:predicted ATPase/DNA-binding SARP family transcriptional activator